MSVSGHSDMRTALPGNAATAQYRAVLTLARELWIVRDRQRVLEALLQSRGITHPGEIDDWELPATLQAELDAQCRAFVAAIMADIGLQPPAELGTDVAEV